MAKPKLIFLILIILLLAVFVFGFIYWLKYVKTETETKPPDFKKSEVPTSAERVEPTEGGAGVKPLLAE